LGCKHQNKPKLKSIHKKIKLNPEKGEHFLKEKGLLETNCDVYRDEESFYIENARVQWLRLGDQNTSSLIKSNLSSAETIELRSQLCKDVISVEDPEKVEYEVLGFFQKLMGANSNFFQLNEERVNACYISKALCSTEGLTVPKSDCRRGKIHTVLSRRFTVPCSSNRCGISGKRHSGSNQIFLALDVYLKRSMQPL
jgi:hypothetical protein